MCPYSVRAQQQIGSVMSEIGAARAFSNKEYPGSQSESPNSEQLIIP